ncbi:MAG: glycosyltransferase involved in cell wall biosynthesis [Sulfitobacter sp.]|jgi:glycosyltransferase involved in cell wall biosynthesis
MKPRHILIVNVFFAPYSYGGATIVAEQVAQALQRRAGYRVTAVSLCCRADLAPYTMIKTEKDGIVNYLINVPEGRSAAEAYDNPAITARMAELLDALRPDLLHAHCLQDIGTGVIRAAKAQNVPVILSVHDFWWLCERQFMIRMDQQYCGQHPVRIENCKGCVDSYWASKTRFDHLQQIGTEVALVTYPSQFSKQLSEESGFAVDKGVVWKNGISQPQTGFFEARQKRRKSDPRLTFGFVGGPSQIKGWPLIKSAFATLGRDDFRVLLVEGSVDGSWWQHEDLSALNGNWQIHPRFDQTTMDDYYAQIDVLLFLSQWKETFGLAIREALARGIDVIQTDSGGTVEHGFVAQDRLIPIGAPVARLQQEILRVLDAHPQQISARAVTGFTAQASQFANLVDRVLGAGQVDQKVTSSSLRS